jgi:hypothetical protein
MEGLVSELFKFLFIIAWGEKKCGNFAQFCSQQGLTALIDLMFLFHLQKSMCCAWRCVTVDLLHDVLWEINDISVTVVCMT